MSSLEAQAKVGYHDVLVGYCEQLLLLTGQLVQVSPDVELATLGETTRLTIEAGLQSITNDVFAAGLAELTA